MQKGQRKLIRPVRRNEETLEAKKMEFETPIGTIKSDSGNHLIDIASVVFLIICVFYFIFHIHI